VAPALLFCGAARLTSIFQFSGQMKYILIRAALLLLAVEAFAQKQSADLLLINGKFITLDPAQPNAEAAAIRADRILAVGSLSSLKTFQDKKTRVIDLQGRTVIPGLFDSHLHVIRGGRFYNLELRWDGVKSLRKALDMLREQAKRTPPGQWVRVVGGWNEYQFEEKRLPTLEEINEATGDVPTFILYLYGHAYLNKAGLKALMIDGSTPNPAGGLIEKDPDGQPTGLLVAEPNAYLLYATLARLPELENAAQEMNSTRLFMRELNSMGVTSVMDAGGGFQNYPDNYVITDSLHRLGQLTVRLPYYLFAQKPGKELEDYQRWIAHVEMEHPGEASAHDDEGTEYHIQGGGENLVAKAADFENFNRPRPDLAPEMEAQLKTVITYLVQHRFPFRLHATYNESITRFLNVIEEVHRETPLNGLIWFFDHAETVSDDNLRRIKALGGGIAIQHRMAYQGENFIRRYGKKAALEAPPVRKMLQMGIPVGMGTDGTRVASYNPWVGMYWLISGRSIGGNEVLGPDQRLGRLEALQLFTKGSASLIRTDADRGSIRAGELADLAVLDTDFLQVAAEKIPEIRSVLTLLDGKIVYASDVFTSHGPAPLKATPDWSPLNFFGAYQK
jgi:predicted amidohydrolase YtcJ